MNRTDFLRKMTEMATPVLSAASNGRLRRTMTIEQKPGAGREKYAGLEAVARLLNGMAPWFEAQLNDPAELAMREDFLNKALLAIEGQVDPASDDFIDYIAHAGPHSQILVDTAFLAQAMLRAPNALWGRLAQTTQGHVLDLLHAAGSIEPHNNNWLLFSTEVELALREFTGRCADDLIARHFNTVDSWYFGDGWYGDGPRFTTDYYNSLVIHPMLLDLGDKAPDLLCDGAQEEILSRAQRHAEVLENMVAPDGTYIATGRSLAYRCGVFHLLAQLAWQTRLPSSVSSAVAREILCCVAEKTLASGSYREDGFLNIGICKAQPEHGEDYICTGSLYMAAAVFLPLGLAADDVFWQLEAEQWTQRAVWDVSPRLL